MLRENATIAAIATPVGTGGIGIIRISGPRAKSVAESVFRISGNIKPESHRFYYGHVIDSGKNRIIDEALLVIMEGPRSYTKEDVAEIHIHSGPAVLRSVFELVISKGAKTARPGEFTKRAFLNGRIDLTQAEAVIDIISARTEKARELAATQLKGGLREKILAIRNVFKDILVKTESVIDFPDETEEVENLSEDIDTSLLRVISDLKALLKYYREGELIREGLKIVITGKPNVGKSSLMNRLVKKEKAIVTPIPGTTRDIVEESLVINGIRVMVSDTAGLHDTDDPIEKIGMKKTRAQLDEAGLVLFMTDLTAPLSREDHEIFDLIRKKQVIRVKNKLDKKKEEAEKNLPDRWLSMPCVEISALTGQGMDKLKKLISETAISASFDSVHPVIPNARHKKSIEKSLEAALAAKKGMENGFSPELICMDIKDGMDSLGDIIGINIREDILDEIFSRFCIGK